MSSCKMFLTHVCQFIVPAISILATIVPLLSCDHTSNHSSTDNHQSHSSTDEKRAYATFNDGGVMGKINFRQANSSSHVVVIVSLRNLQSEARKVNIHEYPTPNNCAQSDKCSERFTGQVFHNKFLNLRSVYYLDKGYKTTDITLFGRDSIVGRSLVIYRDVDNSRSRWICANIEPRGKMVTLTATFIHPLTGTVVLRQRKGDPDSDTSVFVDLRGNGNVSGVDHQWHVHASPVNHSEDMPQYPVRRKRHEHTNESKICESGMGHYDPHNASVRHDNYSEECGGHKMEKCEIGDLAGKLGLLSFTEVEDGSLVAKMFKTDTNLPLSGHNSVVGRSIVIHSRDEDNSRLACANIMAKKDKPKMPLMTVHFRNHRLRICNGTSYIEKNWLANKPSVSFDCVSGKYYTVALVPSDNKQLVSSENKQLVPSDNKQHILWLVMNIHRRNHKCKSDEGLKTPYMLHKDDRDQNRAYVLIILEQKTMIKFRMTYVLNETSEHVGLKAFSDTKSLKKYTSVHLLPK